MKHVEITPELAEKMATAIDEADTAFSVISISDGLTPQARGSLKRAWHEIQTVMAELKGPNSAYAAAVEENRAKGVAP